MSLTGKATLAEHGKEMKLAAQDVSEVGILRKGLKIMSISAKMNVKKVVTKLRRNCQEQMKI